MTTKYHQDGHILSLVAPSGGVTSGVPKLFGKQVVLPIVTAAEDETFAAYAGGVIQATKVGSQAWTEGARVYWDAGDSRFTTTAADGVPAGVSVGIVGSGAGETTGYVKLDATGAPQAAVVAALTDGTLTGTANGAMEIVGATNSGDVSGAIMNNFKECQTQINAILTALKAAGLMANA